MRIVRHDASHHVAHLADGTQYAVRIDVDDPAPLHREIVAAIVAGAPVEVAPPRDLEAVRQHYLAKLDRDAAAMMGQPATEAHRLKLEEARDVLDAVDTNGDGERDVIEVAAMNSQPLDVLQSRYPLLFAGLGTDAPDIVGVALVVAAAADRAKRRVADIERVRMACKASLKAASTVEAVEAAFRAVTLKKD